MGWSPTNPRKCPARCVFGAERERLVNRESSDGPNAQIYTDQTALVAFPHHLIYSTKGKTAAIYCYNKSPASKFRGTPRRLGGRYRVTGIKVLLKPDQNK